MKLSALSRPSTILRSSFPAWLHWCSVITLIVSIGFLGVSLFADNYHRIFAASLVPSLLVALTFAVFLNIYSFWHLRRQHRQTDQDFRYTRSEEHTSELQSRGR